MLNVEIQNTTNENNVNLMRKFTKQVRSSGVIKKIKSLRYDNRNENKALRKKNTLRTIKKNKDREKLIRLGKIQNNRIQNTTRTLG